MSSDEGVAVKPKPKAKPRPKAPGVSTHGGVAAEQARAAALESARLVDEALSIGVLARAKAAAPRELKPSRALLSGAEAGRDVVKGATTRKNRYLFVLPAQLAPSGGGGTLGALAQLDTPNPILYLTFPEGRLKLRGSLVHPRSSRYVTLNFGGRGSVGVEEAFDSALVFSEAVWVGTEADNPTEAPLPTPPFLAAAVQDAAADDARFACVGGGAGAAEGPAGGVRRGRAPAAERPEASWRDTSSEEEGGCGVAGARPRRSAAVKEDTGRCVSHRPSGAHSDAHSDEGEPDHSQDSGHSGGKRQRQKRALPKRASAASDDVMHIEDDEDGAFRAPPRKKAASKAVERMEVDEDDDAPIAVSRPAARAPPGAKGAAAQGRASAAAKGKAPASAPKAKAKKKRRASSSEEEESADDAPSSSDEVEDDEEELPKKSAARQPPPARTKRASAPLKPGSYLFDDGNSDGESQEEVSDASDSQEHSPRD